MEGRLFVWMKKPVVKIIKSIEEFNVIKQSSKEGDKIIWIGLEGYTYQFTHICKERFKHCEYPNGTVNHEIY